MHFTIGHFEAALIRHVERPDDIVTGSITVTKAEFQSTQFDDILSERVYRMRDQILRQAAIKWRLPRGVKL